MAVGPKTKSEGASSFKAKLERASGLKAEAQRHASRFKAELQQRTGVKAERLSVKAEPLKAEAVKAEPRIKSEPGSHISAAKHESKVKEEGKLKVEVKCETSARISELVERGLKLRAMAEKVKREVKKEPLRKVKKERGKGKKRKKPRKKGSLKRRNASREVMNRAVALSPELAELVGAPELSRPEVAKRLWAHCRDRGLLNPADRREALFDERLQRLFGQRSARIYDLHSLMMPHLDYSGRWTGGQFQETPAEAQAGPATCEKAEAEAVQSKREGEGGTKAEWGSKLEHMVEAELGPKLERLQKLEKLGKLEQKLEEQESAVSLGGAKRELQAGSQAAKREPEAESPVLEVEMLESAVSVKGAKPHGLHAGSQAAKRERAADSPVLEVVTLESAEPDLHAGRQAAKRQREAGSPAVEVVTKQDGLEVMKREPLAATPVVLARVQAIVPRLSETGRTHVSVECQAPPGAFGLEAVARPVHEGPVLRQPCALELREGPGGDMEAHAQARLDSLDPAQAYRVAIEAHGTSSAELTLPQRASAAKWSPHEAQMWCSSLQLPELARKVAEYRIDGATLLALGEEDLRALGLSAPVVLRSVLAGLQELRGG